MVALQIRDVPEAVRDELAARARTQGQSLQALLLRLVEDEAQRSRNLALLERFADRSDGSYLASEEAADSLDRIRAERTMRLAGEVPSSGGTT